MATTPSTLSYRDPIPTLPERGYSGTAIKARVIKAMEEQLEGERRCLTELDRLLSALERNDTVPPPPPAPTKQPSRPSMRRVLDSTVH